MNYFNISGTYVKTVGLAIIIKATYIMPCLCGNCDEQISAYAHVCACIRTGTYVYCGVCALI